jgi:hypothetical protein
VSSWAQGTWQSTLLGRTLAGDAVSATNTEAVFLYDTDLNITWLRDANVNVLNGRAGRMDWQTAMGWADTLSVGGFSNWRLPTITLPDPTCQNNQSSGEHCLGSELGHLWYTTLGNVSANQMTQTVPFLNVRRFDEYWTDTPYAGNNVTAWYQNFARGTQGFNLKSLVAMYGMAVRPGDVLGGAVTPVPEPETWAMLLAGLGLLGALARRNRHKTSIK